MELKIEKIKGTFLNYSKVSVDKGYCFYDVDYEEENRNYTTSITTPLTDEEAIRKKYIVVQGNAEELNAELEEEKMMGVKDNGSI